MTTKQEMDDLVRRFDNRESEEMFEQRKYANRHITKEVYEHIKKEMDLTQAKETAIQFLEFIISGTGGLYTYTMEQTKDGNFLITEKLSAEKLWDKFIESQINNDK